ncbi:MAG TPA: hypothetical protein VII53_04195 [Solirubrobacteraceae bacterium]
MLDSPVTVASPTIAVLGHVPATIAATGHLGMPTVLPTNPTGGSNSTSFGALTG